MAAFDRLDEERPDDQDNNGRGKSIFDNNWLATELERFEINYDNISVYPDLLVADTVNELEEWLKTTMYHRYSRIKQRKYKYMVAEKFNELIIKCWKHSNIALRVLDIFDVIVTFYELDYALSWEQLSYDHKLRMAKDIEEKTGDTKLLKQVMQSRINDDIFDVIDNDSLLSSFEI